MLLIHVAQRLQNYEARFRRLNVVRNDSHEVALVIVLELVITPRKLSLG
jgi:hypothetical protein